MKTHLPIPTSTADTNVIALLVSSLVHPVVSSQRNLIFLPMDSLLPSGSSLDSNGILEGDVFGLDGVISWKKEGGVCRQRQGRFRILAEDRR